MASGERREKTLYREEHEYALPGGRHKDEFSRFVEQRRKDIEGKRAGGMSTRDLADKLGIGYEQFRKMVNKQKPTTKRDFVIGVCAMLQLGADETNEALKIYGGMEPLSKRRPRDGVIIDILEQQFGNPMTIGEVDQALVERGHDGLDLLDRRKPREDPYPFPRVHETVECRVDELLYGDPYDSLNTVYHPSRYHVTAKMWLRDDVSNRIFALWTGPSGACNMDVYSKGCEWETRWFEDVGSTGEFLPCFERLRTMARAEQRRMAGFLLDTRNYLERSSARVIDGKVHVFVETYNYSVPEWGEYYLMERVGGDYELSVSGRGQFMGRYLTPEDYEEYYGMAAPTATETHASLEEIRAAVGDRSSSWMERDKMMLRAVAYERMKDKVDAFADDLGAGKVRIANIESVNGGVPYDVRFGALVAYGITEEFGCTYDEEGEINAIGTDVMDVSLPDGSSMMLTLDDLANGFGLGLGTPQEVAAFLRENGSLDIVDLL